MNSNSDYRKEAILLYGVSGSGKTTQALACYQQVISCGKTAGGILAPGTFQDGKRNGFSIMDLYSQKEIPFASVEPIENPYFSIGKFYFTWEGFRFGKNAIQHAIERNVSLLIIDEIGLLECAGKGWAQSLQQAVEHSIGTLLLTVRPALIESVQKQFLETYHCIPISAEEPTLFQAYWETRISLLN